MSEQRHEGEEAEQGRGRARNRTLGSLALGAMLVGMGFPFLKAASEGLDAVREFLEQFLGELRVAMQLTGAATVADLRRVPVVVLGQSGAWLERRGFGEVLREMARRDV